MRKFLVILVLSSLAGATSAYAGGPELTTDEQKTVYALGLLLSRSLESFELKGAEAELAVAGFTDGALRRDKKVNVDDYQNKIQELRNVRISAAAGVEKNASKAFLDQAAQQKGAKRTASGLVYMEVKAGAGEHPKATDKVKVHYHGTLTDGTVFDSSVERGQPATFPLNRVIPCWTEGVQLMKVGGKSKLICPSDIAYGDSGRPPKIKPGATLVFEVELLEILQ